MRPVDIIIFIAGFACLMFVWNWAKREGLESASPMELTLRHQGKIERLIALIQKVDVNPDMIEELQTITETHRQNILDIQSNMTTTAVTNRPDAYPS